MSKTATIYHVDGREKEVEINEASRLTGAGTVGAGRAWSFTKPLPQGWDREVPRYRVARETQPAAKARYRTEPPFSESVGSDSSWQYGDRVLAAREEIETRLWPHSSFIPLNHVAKKIMAFFNSRLRSRLPQSPFDSGGALRLDDGLSGPLIVSAVPPQLKPMDLRPAS
jgi:hypothetical protein